MVRKAKKVSPQQRMLTDAELEIMQILWGSGSATAAQVKERHPLGEKLAYTTISTMLRVLEQKGFVQADKQGRGHIYSVRLNKEDYQSRTVNRVVQTVFDGVPLALVRQLLEQKQLSDDELEEMRRLLT